MPLPPEVHNVKYGKTHRSLRKRIAQDIAAGIVDCARCGQPIRPDEPFDLGHVEVPSLSTINVARSFVYEHAEELRAYRLGRLSGRRRKSIGKRRARSPSEEEAPDQSLTCVAVERSRVAVERSNPRVLSETWSC
jgi:hypothetical protein